MLHGVELRKTKKINKIDATGTSRKCSWSNKKPAGTLERADAVDGREIPLTHEQPDGRIGGNSQCAMFWQKGQQCNCFDSFGVIRTCAFLILIISRVVA